MGFLSNAKKEQTKKKRNMFQGSTAKNLFSKINDKDEFDEKISFLEKAQIELIRLSEQILLKKRVLRVNDSQNKKK